MPQGQSRGQLFGGCWINSDSQCRLPHDRVYAILPMLPPNLRSELRLEVDYSTPLLPPALRIVSDMLLEYQEIDRSSPSALFWDAVIKLARDRFQLNVHDRQNADFVITVFKYLLRASAGNLPERPDSSNGRKQSTLGSRMHFSGSPKVILSSWM